jgi:hypothetical protein
MKSKEEILHSHYSEGKDGMPEISADGLLKAMEEYSEQSFNAAREISGDVKKFPAYPDYLSTIEMLKPRQEDYIRLTADNVVSQFLPTDPDAKDFSFSFKNEGINYTALYTKNAQGFWEYDSFR